MERTESAGIGVAIVGHVLLILALKVLFDQPRDPPSPPEAMEVSFVEDSAVVSTAPTTEAEEAPSFGEEMGAPEEASGADAAVPAEVVPEEEVVAPTPPPTVDMSERRRPDITRNAVPIRTPAPPRPQPRAQPQARPRPPVQAQPRPPVARPQPRPAATPGRGQAQRSSGFDPRRLAESLGGGPPQSRGESPSPPARLTGAQQQQLARNISGLIAPCAVRARAPNGFARSISVDLRVNVTSDGVPTGHTLISSSGTNDSNEDYVDDVVGVAMRAVRACSSRIATLPSDHYAIPGGWRTFRYRFRFP